MHSLSLDTAAGILILSSIVFLSIHVKRTPKSRLVSSTSVLSISDVSSSILTAILILFHHLYVGESTNVDLSTYYGIISERGFDKNDNITVNSADQECDNKSIFFQYAIFFLPFINVFISLLCFSMNFYTNTKSMNQRCCESLRMTERQENSEIEKSKSKTIFNKKYTGFALLSQWAIPALFTGAFQFGERVRTDSQSAEDLICMISANFLFENCHETYNHTNEVMAFDTIGSSSYIHNYVSSEDNLPWPSPNSSAVHDTVSKIYDIMLSVMNDLTFELNNSQSHNDLIGNPRKNESFQSWYYLNDQGKMTKSLLLSKMNDPMKTRAKAYVKPSFLHVNLPRENFTEGVLENMMIIRQCTKNRCFISNKFLKMYLFALFLFIYIAPIFISTLLLVISHYQCREISLKIETIDSQRAIFDLKKKSTNAEHTSDVESFSGNANSIPVLTEQDIKQNEHSDERLKSKIQESMCKLSCETEKMQSFHHIQRINLIVAVLLWTPLFLQVLSKVYFCSNVPNWLMETAYIATTVFAIFKNAVNLNLVRIENDDHHFKKYNSISPKGDSR